MRGWFHLLLLHSALGFIPLPQPHKPSALPLEAAVVTSPAGFFIPIPFSLFDILSKVSEQKSSDSYSFIHT